MTEAVSELHDKIEGLEAELFEAVKVAYSRGAVAWTKSNYPSWYERLKLGGGQPRQSFIRPNEDEIRKLFETIFGLGGS